MTRYLLTGMLGVLPMEPAIPAKLELPVELECPEEGLMIALPAEAWEQ